MIKKIGFIYIVLLSIVSTTTIAQDLDSKISTVDSIKNTDLVSFENNYYSALNEKVKGNYQGAIELLKEAIRYSPNNAAAQYEISVNYKNIKDYRRAILFGENSVIFNKNQKWYWLNIAEMYSVIGDNKNAERCYKELVFLDSKFSPDYIKSIAKTGNLELALSKVDDLLSVDNTQELLILKRDLFIANNKKNDAINLTKELIKQQPYEAKFYSDIAILLVGENRTTEAKEEISKGLAIFPDNPVLTRQKFRILMTEESLEQAISLIDTSFRSGKLNFNEKLGFVIDFVDLDPNHEHSDKLINSLKKWADYSNEVGVYPIIGNLYKINNNPEEALKNFKIGFENGYSEFATLIEMLALEQELKQYDLLLSDSEKVIKLFPSHPVLFLFKGFAASQLSDFTKSIDALNTGLSLVENNKELELEFYSMLGSSYYGNNESEKAFASLDKALSLEQENTVVLNNYSYYLAEEGLELDKALEMMNTVISLDNKNTTYLDTLAWVYYKKGDYNKAKGILKRILAENKVSNAGILEHYGDVLYKLDKTNSAVIQWERAYEIANNSDILKQKIENRSLIYENK